MSLNTIVPCPPALPLNCGKWPSAPPPPPINPWTISSEAETTPPSSSLPSKLINEAVAHRARLVAKAKERR
ncbi:unnamed protein product [Clonostachys solani]|uniref:Uncharacterized protein n=1 Tax=Clonostachys solani TaxID=160281 RepID=A0A9N9W0S7_9HYPO|nr:unnamed protein product [Clonostachys solani]